jgi:hypothetical protein
VPTVPESIAITEVTLGEVYRLQLAQTTVLEGIRESMDKRPTWEDINRQETARDKAEQKQNEAIKALEDNNRWTWRTLAAAAITALAGLVLSVSKTL